MGPTTTLDPSLTTLGVLGTSTEFSSGLDSGVGLSVVNEGANRCSGNIYIASLMWYNAEGYFKTIPYFTFLCFKNRGSTLFCPARNALRKNGAI
jgi:hypothetical protein